jgi:dipeptidyl aminopeptidase/acylaminoacyl peptidase
MKIKKLIVVPMVLSVILLTSCGGEKTTGSTDKTSASPAPILDRELFFGNPEISSGQLSPDGKYISFLKEYEGIMNIWVKAFDEPFENAYPLTNSKRPLAGYFWTVDGKYILFVKDNAGDENMNVFAVDPTQKVEGGVPESRNLTPMEEVTARIAHVSQNNPDMLMVMINDRDKAWHDLYELTLSSGKLEKIYENNDRITGYDFDWDDNLRLLYKTDKQGNTIMYHIQNKELTPIYETSVSERAAAVNWNEDNSKLYLMTNKGDLNLMTLYLMDPLTKEMELIESDPEKKVDLSGVVMNRKTRKMVYTSYSDDKTRYYWKDDTRKAIYEHLANEFPGREISFTSATDDYSKFLVAVHGDKYAAESWFYDTETKELIHQYTPRPELKEVEEHLAAMQPVTYPSSDGLKIPAYLTVPVGAEAKNLPTVVLVHGGPKGPRDYWGYDPFVQFLANRGYAVLQPNFRASGGYGKEFMNAGDLQWGKLMQDDITWGVKYLIEKGIADKDKVAIMGGSYGGYATLAGLAFTPDVYACGVDIVGPSNIFTLLESIPPYWEAGRAFLYGMVGDPNTDEGKKLIKEASPLFSADKITKPLLVVQGANDPRVKKAEADQIVVALRDKGHEVSYLLADDEGHGFRKPVNRMAMFAEVERFLAPILGGRYQEDMPEDVASRLEELKVPIDSVQYTE